MRRSRVRKTLCWWAGQRHLSTYPRLRHIDRSSGTGRTSRPARCMKLPTGAGPGGFADHSMTLAIGICHRQGIKTRPMHFSQLRCPRRLSRVFSVWPQGCRFGSAWMILSSNFLVAARSLPSVSRLEWSSGGLMDCQLGLADLKRRCVSAHRRGGESATCRLGSSHNPPARSED